ncbi:MAG TPA: polyprenyl synthetase family protein [Propionibacteriaceae bacterium]|nr:polyprenyl synthetase family protein [Propionibacteriaceae bacterium]
MVHTHSAATVETVLDPQNPLSQGFREAISAEVTAFLAEQATVLESMGPELVPVQLMASQLLCGGKRLRPGFCVWGFVAAAGRPDEIELRSLLTAAASLDVLHGSALIHDDVMDASDLRRGRPAAHRQFEALHVNAGWLGDSESFGKAGAIILGDLLVMWSAQMLHASGLDQTVLERALPIVEAMRTEVTCGQYLDIVAQAHPLRQRAPAIDSVRPSIELALDDASRVVEYKAARYTVQRPAQIGAALGGGDDELYYALGAYGSPLGRAFQFRDDLLGVFGDPQLTGKPSGDDLREGKRTVLIAHAYAHAGAAGQKLLVQRLGDPNLTPEGVAELQQVITESGAREAVETMITDGYERAIRALQDADITDEGRVGLTALAEAAVRRET